MKHTVLGVLGAVFLVAQALGAEDPFADFISPVSNPVNFEDPRATTELRPIYIYHHINQDFVTGGGDAHIVALQIRLALTGPHQLHRDEGRVRLAASRGGRRQRGRLCQPRLRTQGRRVSQ